MSRNKLLKRISLSSMLILCLFSDLLDYKQLWCINFSEILILRTLSYCHSTMPLFHHATISPCHYRTMLLSHHATISPCHYLTMSPYHHNIPRMLPMRSMMIFQMRLSARFLHAQLKILGADAIRLIKLFV
jgi:hypothetical protein